MRSCMHAVTTVVFTLSGVNILTFAAAASVALVRTLANIYGGVLARETAGAYLVDLPKNMPY